MIELRVHIERFQRECRDLRRDGGHHRRGEVLTPFELLIIDTLEVLLVATESNQQQLDALAAGLANVESKLTEDVATLQAELDVLAAANDAGEPLDFTAANDAAAALAASADAIGALKPTPPAEAPPVDTTGGSTDAPPADGGMVGDNPPPVEAEPVDPAATGAPPIDSPPSV